MNCQRSRTGARALAAAIVLASVGLSTVAAAQTPYGQPGQYTPQPQPYGQPAGPGQYNPYPQPNAQPGPYAQPIPYGNPQATPGYVPLGGSSDDFTSDRAHSWPVLRVSVGTGLHFAPQKRILPAFVLDATAGYRWALAPRLSIAFEGGFSYDSEPTRGGMYGTLGAGPELYLTRYLQIGWDPKLVIGGAWSGFAIGVRNTLIVPLFMHVVNVEVGHQYLRAGSDDRHELRAQIGFDVAGLAQLLLTRTLAR
jgi:hypothetical protein